MNIYVCLPCYNEAENLPDLLGNLGVFNVFAVDDGSSDRTLQILHAQGVPTLVHKENMGLAEAYKTAIEYVKGTKNDDDIIVFMDADNTHDPKAILNMMKPLELGADIVIASRYHPDSEVLGVPFERRILSSVVNLLIRKLCRVPVKECTCGYRAYKAKVLKDLPLLEAKGFEVSAEVLIKACRHNPPYKIVEIPFVLHYYRKKGVSKLHLFDTVKAYLRLLWKNTQIDFTPFVRKVAYKIGLGKIYDRDQVFWNDGMTALAFLIVSFFIYDTLTYSLPQLLRLAGYVGIAFVSFCIQHFLRRFWVFKK